MIAERCFNACHFGQRGEPLGPVLVAAGDQANVVTVDAREQAIAVELDLVAPRIVAGDLVDEMWPVAERCAQAPRAGRGVVRGGRLLLRRGLLLRRLLRPTGGDLRVAAATTRRVSLAACLRAVFLLVAFSRRPSCVGRLLGGGRLVELGAFLFAVFWRPSCCGLLGGGLLVGGRLAAADFFFGAGSPAAICSTVRPLMTLSGRSRTRASPSSLASSSSSWISSQLSWSSSRRPCMRPRV